MKAASLYSPDDIRIDDFPVPVPGPGDALLKTRASGICSGDVMPWYVKGKAPFVIGHEPSGEIVEVGREVRDFKAGDRVFVHHHAPCFLCRRCKRGDYVQCSTWKETSIVPGGVSEYILIPRINLQNDTLELPDSVGFEDGALIEPLACVLKGFKRSNIKRGDTVLVIGLGFMGMLNVIAARRFGAKKVIGADMVDWRLGKAIEFGADDVIDVSEEDLAPAIEEMTGGDMADIVIVGPNSAGAMEQGIMCTGPGGTAVLFTPAMPGESLTLDPNGLYFRDVSIAASYSCGPTDTADALEMIKGGVVKAEGLVTHRFPIEETKRAYEITKEAGESLKCMIVFE